MRLYKYDSDFQLTKLRDSAYFCSKVSDKLFREVINVAATDLLHKLNDVSSTALIGEGFASGRSIRMAIEQQYPYMVAIDAGNFLSNAQRHRAEWSDELLVFAVDDGGQIKKQLAKALVSEFSIAATLVIDGEALYLTEADFASDDEAAKELTTRLAATGTMLDLKLDGSKHEYISEDGSMVSVFATLMADEFGLQYIQAHLVRGHQDRTIRFENVGLIQAHAAAKEVGNAIVVSSRFDQHGTNKWTDFNDLYVYQSLAAVRELILSAHSLDQALVASDYDDNCDSLYDQAFAVVLEYGQASISLLQRHFRIGYRRAERLIQKMEANGRVSTIASNGLHELI